MATAIAPKSRFSLEGRFLGFAPGASSPRKFMTVQTSTEALAVKLSKSLRLMLHGYLTIGDWIRLVGTQKLDPDTQEWRYKAHEVIKIPAPTTFSPLPVQASSISATAQPSFQKPKKVLICNKSACRKRGSGALCHLLETVLAESGRSEQVTVKKTGCMDRCKTGPHLVFVPDKQRYSKVTAAMLPGLMEKHLRG
ncbi:MAG: (2Fe-2S) ferredoxin domain-containing protein [Cyanobacteria bacterium]|nr:(2Fe-2S) ferredoxin domain-containing protein [Cyanobacteriota bacterium]MDA0866704.1 (2Fe-2S) ferredoxin domain-containing protein [Cyanobacteriota bacterium]